MSECRTFEFYAEVKETNSHCHSVETPHTVEE
jgi:hypothetical protein